MLAYDNRLLDLDERLLADGVITAAQLEQADALAREKRLHLTQALAALGFAPVDVLGRNLGEHLGFPFVELSSISVDGDTGRLLPEELVRRKLVLPFQNSDEGVLVAMVDPLDLATVDDLRARIGRRVVPFVAFEADLREAIGRVFNSHQKTQSVIREIAEAAGGEPELSVDTLLELAEDAPIVRLVNSIIASAITSGASDIHIEPQERDVRVRFRQDGMLYVHALIPRHHLAAVVSRIKIISQMDIAERRRPQDGRFGFRDNDGNQFDVRVNCLPVIHGEKTAMRILPKSSSFGDLGGLGLFPDQRTLFESFIRRPHGIILVTGPTGSGKSTTLFAALNQINDSLRNINTVEDPVEYNVPGVNQMQINPKIGVTFAAGLRTLLRQDPDVIMVGEIRDRETAEIAVQAALTGHLVFSTLHTNDAAGALTRLQNMGVEPYLISSALVGVIGQRLLRTLCPHCREMRAVTRVAFEAMGVRDLDAMPTALAHGQGCSKCGGRGMKGRTAVFELLAMSDGLREMVLRHCDSNEMRACAIRDGMVTMRDAGVRRVLQGVTTPDEVVRVLFSEEF